MATTRDFKSLGVVASDAQQVTEEGLRNVGEFYRRTNLTDSQQVSGELFDVNPSTEFLNQKVFNSSSFTDTVDTRGIVGWTNLVEYAPPAVVWASTGTPGTGDFYFCLRSNGPSSIVVDPVTDNQINPIYWRLLENPAQLRLDLADETPGSEGSRIVGHNNIDANGGIDEGVITKSALDNVFFNLEGSKNFEILASGNFLVQLNSNTPPDIEGVSVFSHFNTLPQNVEVIPKLDGVGDPTSLAQGMKVTFENPIPTPYNIQVYDRLTDGVAELPSRRRTIISYDNILSTSVEIYQRVIPNIPEVFEFPAFRIFNFMCYRHNP